MQELNSADREYLLNTIRNIPDFPKPGIEFKDITTLLNNKKAFKFLLDHLEARYKPYNLDFIAGIDSRGFIFGAPLADRLGIGFVPIRKQGKLPYTTIGEKYALEYGFDEIEVHIDAFKCQKASADVLLIDDLIATGGTAKAAANLVNQAGANCVEACFLINLTFLEGDKELKEKTTVYSVLEIN
ncbi:MAG: adenine phosphoribosyltransferase [Epsilonproteobacteria bacterium]|nr:adenine phosphoribosyltransferase [Campylobacterota bacterium]